MRLAEIHNNVPVMITNEEDLVVSKVEKKGMMPKNELSEREVVLANRLVSKGVLKRKRNEAGVYFARHNKTTNTTSQ